MTLVAHEFETFSTNGLDIRAGEIIVPTPENIQELQALGQLVIAHYLDAEGNPAYLPGSSHRPAPSAPPKGADQATIEAFHRDFATWSDERKQPAPPRPVSPALGYPRVTESTGYYALNPYEGSAQTMLPYRGVGSALFRVQYAEIVV